MEDKNVNSLEQIGIPKTTSRPTGTLSAFATLTLRLAFADPVNGLSDLMIANVAYRLIFPDPLEWR